MTMVENKSFYVGGTTTRSSIRKVNPDGPMGDIWGTKPVKEARTTNTVTVGFSGEGKLKDVPAKTVYLGGTVG